MRNKTKGKKTEAASYQATMASVSKEMAQPRVAESALRAADEQSKKSRGKPTSHHAERAAKPHIEHYGTGTPAVEKSPERYQEIAGRGPNHGGSFWRVILTPERIPKTHQDDSPHVNPRCKWAQRCGSLSENQVSRAHLHSDLLVSLIAKIAFAALKIARGYTSIVASRESVVTRAEQHSAEKSQYGDRHCT